MARDFKVQRGTTTVASGATTATITAGVDYTAPSAASKAFCRVVSTQTALSSCATTATAYSGATIGMTVDDSAITTSITFQRGAATAINGRVDWEIVEYIGPDGGVNEFVVRGRGLSTFSAASNTLTTGAVSGVVTDADVLPWVTGTRQTDAAGTDFARNYCVTSTWNNAGDTITFTRNRQHDTTPTISWAAIEWTGSNWSIQTVEATIAAADTPQAVTITTVGDVTRAFLHTQQRGISNVGRNSTFRAWISSPTEITLLTAVGYGANNITVRCWVVANSQTDANRMVVARYTGSRSASGTWTAHDQSVTDVGDMADASVVETTLTTASTDSVPNMEIATFRMTSSTQVTGFRSRSFFTGSEWTYRFATVVWPLGIPPVGPVLTGNGATTRTLTSDMANTTGQFIKLTATLADKVVRGSARST